MALSPTQLVSYKNKLYDACAPLSKDDPKKTFTQAALFELGIIPDNDINIMLQVAQGLVYDKLFKIFGQDGNLGWRLRSPEEAKKYRSLKPEHEIIYALIDEAGSEGLWSKTIRTRSNVHEAIFKNAIKVLESKQMIRSMKSVEHPNRLMYIKSNLQLSARATGGSWFTDGVLDEGLIDTVLLILTNYIKKKSWYTDKERKKPKKTFRGTAEDAQRDCDAVLGGEKEMEKRDEARATYGRMLPMPAGFEAYPGADEMTLFLLQTEALQNCTLSGEEVQQLLDVLVFDGRIERLVGADGGFVYKSVRKTFLHIEEQMDSVLGEAPCGRCPVFNLCEEGGPVGPSNCSYFAEWLGL